MKKMSMMLFVFWAFAALAEDPYTQERLEKSMWFKGACPQDDFVNFPEPEYVPLWERDAIKEHSDFISKGGWTTNQLIDALILAVTNRLQKPSVLSHDDELIAGMSFSALSEINLPRANEFVLQLCTNNVRMILADGVDGVYAYSRLEPEVFDYLYRLCVMTNRYSKVVGQVAMDIEKCLANVPDAQKPAATNRVAKYHYFVINHATASNGLVDDELSRLLPSYVNSIQRLRAMRHVANTTTHAGVLRYATNQVHRLEALPTNALNNVQWLEE